MATSSSPIRIDKEIHDSAKVVAESQDRSAAQQVSHWARVGRAVEMAPHISLSDIEDVLDGRSSYDGLNDLEQAFVRARWEEIAEERSRSLNFAKEFGAVGRQYSGLDEDGNAVVYASRDADAHAST